MILRCYSVFDKAVKAFNPALTFRSEAEAMRSFAEACTTEGTPFKKHSPDYAFFFIGLFDDNMGRFENNDSGPLCVMEAVSASGYFSPQGE